MVIFNIRRRNNSSHRFEAVLRDFNPRPRSSVQRVWGQSQRPFIQFVVKNIIKLYIIIV